MCDSVGSGDPWHTRAWSERSVSGVGVGFPDFSPKLLSGPGAARLLRQLGAAGRVPRVCRHGRRSERQADL